MLFQALIMEPAQRGHSKIRGEVIGGGGADDDGVGRAMFEEEEKEEERE